mgnify:FL=1
MECVTTFAQHCLFVLFGRNKGTLAGQVLNSNVAQVEDPVSTTKSFFDDDDEFNPRAPTGARGS